jgi:putative peptidoglycan lipid II flippase
MSHSTKQDTLVNTAEKPLQALNKTPTIIENALKMAFGTMTSRVLGVLRESLLAALFDKSITDAWAAAFKIPNLFRRLLGEGSLSVSFIPQFVQAREDSPERARNLVNSLYAVLLIVLGALTTLGMLFPEVFLNAVLSPVYRADLGRMELTIHMARIMFLFVFFITSFAFFMGILNSLGQFFWPALAPTFWNLAMVISTIWPRQWLSPLNEKYGDQLAWGVVAGGFLQAAILLPGLVKSGYLPRPKIDLRNRDMWSVFRNMLPGIVGTGLLQFMTLLNLRFSSSFPEGTISYINYVDRLIELPLSLVSVSLGSALLPALSLVWAQNKKEEFAQTSRRYLEMNLWLSLAAAFGLFALAEPIIQLLFGRGKFTLLDVQNAAQILRAYCWIMIFVSGVRVLTPAYYAVKNTWFPMVVSGLSLVTHVFMAPRLMALWGVQGLMASTIISAALNMVFLLGFYSRMIAPFPFGPLVLNTMKASLVGTAVWASAEACKQFFRFPADNAFLLGTQLSLAIGLCLVVFLGLSWLFGFREANALITRLRRRFTFL